MFHSSSPQSGPGTLQPNRSSQPAESESYASVGHATLAYLRQLKPCVVVTPDSWLQDDLSLSDAEMGLLIYTLLALTGHEYEPGGFKRPIRTVEDLILYIASSPLVETTGKLVRTAPTTPTQEHADGTRFYAA